MPSRTSPPSLAAIVPPLWREGRIGLEWAALRRSDVLRGAGVPRGDGPRRAADPRLPGRRRLARHDDPVAARRGLAHQARRASARTSRARRSACARLEERLEALAERTGDRVAIIGQSRGGVFAKALGARRPDLVAGVVTLGSPVLSQLAVHPARARAGRRRRDARQRRRCPALISWRCLRGECCARFRAALAGPFPPEVGYVSLYSRSDGIVDWRSCLDPDADAASRCARSHCGMSLNADAYRAIARALCELRAPATRLGRRRPDRGQSRSGLRTPSGPGLQQRDALDVRRLREHVDRAHALERVAGLDELRRVRRERRRVAGDVDDPLRRRLDDPAHDLLREAGARRVDHGDVGLAGLLDELAHREPDVAGEEARVRDLVAARVVDRVGDRGLDDLDADDLARAAASERPIVPMPQ